MNEPRRVLLVDDEADVLHGAGLWLSTAGYATLTAQNGKVAVKMTRDHHPDAIVMDVRMPVQDGMLTLSELQRDELTKHIPVVMLSASLVDENRALDAGASFFLIKPYNGRDLIAAVDAAVDAAYSAKG